MKCAIIFNPVARGEKALHFRSWLDQLPPGQCQLKPTEHAGHAQDLAAQAVQEGCDIVVAAGGDGTINEVLNGLARVPDAYDRCSLGIIPLGTVNVFAKELSLPIEPVLAWELIKGFKTRCLDLPRIVWENEPARPPTYFAQLAGAGLDSRAIEKVSWPLKKRVGPLAYVVAGFQAMLGPQPILKVESEERELTGELVLIGNGRFYGGRFEFFPRARFDDGLLDVCVFPSAGLLALARTGYRFIFHRKLLHGGVHYFQTRKLRLSSASPVMIEVEGDNVSQLPVEIAMSEKKLRVIVP